MKGEYIMDYYDSIKLEIYEAYDNGEISYDEKEYLLEAVGDELEKETLKRKVINTAKHIGKKVEDGVVDKINTPINNKINKLADYAGKKLVKVDSPKAHKLRNKIRMGVKTAGVVGLNQAVTALTPVVNVVPPLALCYTKSVIKTLQKSKHPLDKVATKQLEKLLENYKDNPKKFVKNKEEPKYDTDKMLKHYNAWNNTNEYVYDLYPESELDT